MQKTTSQPTFADLEIRIFAQEPAGYPVEVTLNREQRLARTHLPADIASLAIDGDPVAVGQRLFNALFADSALRAAWAEARGQARQRRVRLWIDISAPELHALPWELLYEDNTLISASANTPFSRYLATPEPWGGAVEDRPIRVLAVISNPEDLEDVYNLPPLDVDVERAILTEALSPLGQNKVRLDFLDPPDTPARIEQALQRGTRQGGSSYHILYYVGHGAFSQKRKQAALYLQNDEAYTQIVPGAAFTAMLKRQSHTLRLVFLAACQTATPSTAQAYLGLGAKLVEAGVPAVIAMQDKIEIETARELAHTFYSRLAEHGLVDCAMNEARSHLLTANRPDVAVPVLYMRLKSGQLWSDETETGIATTTPHAYHAELHGSGAIAQGPGAVAAGARGVAIGGSVQGGVIITGDGSTVSSPPTPRLPAKCPYCGVSVQPAEVKQLDGTSVICAYCGSTIQATG